MKNNAIRNVICISFLLFQLVSCSNIKKQPPVSVDEDFLNNQILLRAPNFGNTFKTSNPIMLELKYNSNNEIKFPNNYNAEIYEKTSNGWIKIEEEPTITIEPDEIVLAPNIELPVLLGFSLCIFFHKQIDSVHRTATHITIPLVWPFCVVMDEPFI